MYVDMRDLMRSEDGVPPVSVPLQWNMHRLASDNVRALQTVIDEYNAKYLMDGVAIDEAAVMVPGQAVLNQLGNELQAADWEYFNTSDDLVFTNPFGTRYQVEYHFWRHPRRAWRLEVMRMAMGSDRGFSPLHQALWNRNGEPGVNSAYKLPVPHLSYKVLGGQREFSREQARLGAQGSGLVHAQTCQSTYGVFGYWLPVDARHQLYVKPRANLRDGGEGGSACPTDCAHAPDGGNHPVVGGAA